MAKLKDTNPIGIKEFFKEFNNQLYVCPSFQRRFADENILKQQQYIQAIYDGNSCTVPFLLGEIDSAIKGEIDSSIRENYIYRRDEKNVKYLVIDGQHRLEALRNFISNDLVIPELTFPVRNGLKISNETKTNVTYKMLKNLYSYAYDVFNSTPVLVVIYEDDYKAYVDAFDNANFEGDKAKPQDRRNTWGTPLSVKMRKLTDQFEHLFKDILFTPTIWAQRGDGELLARILAMIQGTKAVNATDLDNMFKDVYNGDKGFRTLVKLVELVDMMFKDIKERPKGWKVSYVVDLFILLLEMYRKDITICNYKEFRVYFEQSQAIRAEEKYSFPDLNLRGESYNLWLSGVTVKDNIIARERVIFKDFYTDFEDFLKKDGIVKWNCPRTRFTTADRIRIWWKERDEKGMVYCKLTGKIIPWSEVLDGIKWNVEHNIPIDRADEFKMTKEQINADDNLYLACADANRIKSTMTLDEWNDRRVAA